MAKRLINEMPLTVSDLKPNPLNPRTISEKKHEMLERSMREFGDLSGIVYNIQSKQLVGGHQRTFKINAQEEIVIYQRLNKKTEQGTVAYGHVNYEGEKYAVRIVDWDAKREKAANISANQQGGKWDMKRLSDDLLDLDALNFDMELVGFTPEEMENIFAPKSDETREVTFQVKEGAKELDPNSFDGEHTCPKCGFEFTESK